MMRASGFGEHLQLDYERHPGFNVTQRTFDLDPALLATFNDHYVFARDCATRLPAGEWTRCRAGTRAALEAIFAQLLAQATDEYERQFLEELQTQAVRLLQEELALFGQKSGFRTPALGSAQARDNAMRLAHSRHFFGRLSAAAVAQILAHSAADLDNFRAAVRAGRTRRDDLSVNGGPVVKAIVRILNREFAHQGVLSAVSAYMGQSMQVAGLALELSVAQASWWANSHAGLARAPKTPYAHLDESIVHPKAIAYLTDVGASNGPTSLYPGAYDSLQLEPLQAIIGRVLGNVGAAADSPLSAYYARQYHQTMSSERFRRHFMRLPRRLRFNSHFGWDVLPDSPAEQLLTECESVMTGPAGTYVVFDGARLLHRGGLMESRERLALQIIFAEVSLKRRIAGRVRRLTSRVRKPS